MCVKGNIAKEKGGDLMSQQWNRAIKENPKTTHLPPDETLSNTAKAQLLCVWTNVCVHEHVHSKIYCTKLPLRADDLHLSFAAGAIFVFVSSAKNQSL